MEKKKVDLRLMEAVIRMVLKGPEFPREDVKKITVLDNFGYILCRKFPSWAEEGPGDFSLIGEMPDLHTLHFVGFRGAVPNDQLVIRDFSFLKCCPKLKRLDLRYTNFTDCALLLGLPALNYVSLPPKTELYHLEALEQLPKKVKVSFLDRTPWTLPTSSPQPKPWQHMEKVGSDRVKAIVAELKARTQTKSYLLKIEPDSQPSLLDSKFGGLPYWDPAKPYPTDHTGKKLFLLAQLNFDQLQAEKPLPQGGMLQFFIGQDDLSGLDDEHPDVQDGFRVVYHQTIDPSITEAQIRALKVPTHADVAYSPVYRETAVHMEPSLSWMGPDDARFKALFKEAVYAALGEDVGDQSACRYLDAAEYQYLTVRSSSIGHRLLGYPFFTQSDPRTPDSPYDTLLLQIDTDGVGSEDYILWGDCGVANFFINRRDLENLDFTKVLYHWDCC